MTNNSWRIVLKKSHIFEDKIKRETREGEWDGIWQDSKMTAYVTKSKIAISHPLAPSLLFSRSNLEFTTRINVNLYMDDHIPPFPL